MDVVGIGPAIYDTICILDKKLKPNTGHDLSLCIEGAGGIVANTLVGLSRLGHDASMIGVMGKDETGNKLVKDLKQENVDSSVKKIEGSTGRFIGLLDGSGELTYFFSRGVNEYLDYKNIDLESVNSAEFCYFVLQPVKVKEQITFLKEVETELVINPSKLHEWLDDREKAVPLLAEADIFVSNREEIEFLLQKNYRLAAKALLKKGVKKVVTTLGNEGCYIAENGNSVYVPVFKPQQIADPIGAGDSFTAGLLHSLLEDVDLEMCGRIGNYVASKVLEEHGPRNGLPKKFQKNKMKI